MYMEITIRSIVNFIIWLIKLLLKWLTILIKTKQSLYNLTFSTSSARQGQKHYVGCQDLGKFIVISWRKQVLLPFLLKAEVLHYDFLRQFFLFFKHYIQVNEWKYTSQDYAFFKKMYAFHLLIETISTSNYFKRCML